MKAPPGGQPCGLVTHPPTDDFRRYRVVGALTCLLCCSTPPYRGTSHVGSEANGVFFASFFAVAPSHSREMPLLFLTVLGFAAVWISDYSILIPDRMASYALPPTKNA